MLRAFYSGGARRCSSPCQARPSLLVFSAALCLSACSGSPGGDNIFPFQIGDNWGKSKCSAVTFDRIRLRDLNDHNLDDAILQAPLKNEIKVSLDGKNILGTSAAVEQQDLWQKLSAKIKSKDDGHALLLPWSTTTAMVSGFTAIEIPGEAHKILICGGDEAPNRLRFAADKTWLVDLFTGEIKVGPDLNRPRRFPTLTALNDGRILISGGTSDIRSREWIEEEALDDTSAGDLAKLHPELVKLTPELEIYNPQSGQITAAGRMNIARDETVTVVLGNGLVLIAGGDNARKSEDEDDDGEGSKLNLTMHTVPLTAELYNPGTQQSTMLGQLRGLTSIRWSAPLGTGQALLLGNHSSLDVGNEQLGEPAAELIDTQGAVIRDTVR